MFICFLRMHHVKLPLFLMKAFFETSFVVLMLGVVCFAPLICQLPPLHHYGVMAQKYSINSPSTKTNVKINFKVNMSQIHLNYNPLPIILSSLQKINLPLNGA